MSGDGDKDKPPPSPKPGYITCPSCKGHRYVMSLYAPGEEEACPHCEGEGVVKQTKSEER